MFTNYLLIIDTYSININYNEQHYTQNRLTFSILSTVYTRD